MAYDDGYYYGQCKIICESETVADNGRTVAITGGGKTWSHALEDKIAEFLVPGRAQYTVALLDGSVTKWSGKVEAGYGECIHVMLADGYAPAIEKELDRVEGKADAAQTTANGATTRVGKVEGRLQNNISFGVDAAGRWGYRKNGADPVIPFNPGFALNLGTVVGGSLSKSVDSWGARQYSYGNSANVNINVAQAIANAGMSNAIDYRKLTSNNFILELVSLSAGAKTQCTSAWQYNNPFGEGGSSIVKSYSNGVLTINCTCATAMAESDGATYPSGIAAVAYSQGMAAATVRAWLVVTSPL